MKIGFSKKEIIGDLPLPLAGFAKERVAYEVLDRLYVQCIVFETEEGDVVFYSLDVLNVDHILVDAIRTALKSIDIKSKNIQIFATHTHSAPGGISDVEKTVLIGKQSFLCNLNPSFINKVIQSCMDAYKDAKNTVKQSLIKIGKGEIVGVGSNRIDEKRLGDEKLFVVEIIQDDGNKALLYNFACHPTVLNMDSTVISADLPGAVRDELSEYKVVFFVNGACGDISTRFTRKDNTVSELYRYAKIVKESIEEALIGSVYKGELSILKCKQEFVTLKVKQALREKEANQRLCRQVQAYEEKQRLHLSTQELRLEKSFVEGAYADLEYAKNHEDVSRYTLEVNYIQLQNETIVTVPAELFSALGNQIKKEKEYQIFGYANGYYLYIADKKAYDERTYEAASSPFAKGQGEKFVESILKK